MSGTYSVSDYKRSEFAPELFAAQTLRERIGVWLARRVVFNLRNELSHVEMRLDYAWRHAEWVERQAEADRNLYADALKDAERALSDASTIFASENRAWVGDLVLERVSGVLTPERALGFAAAGTTGVEAGRHE